MSPRKFIRWGRSPSKWLLWQSGWMTRWSRNWLQIWLLIDQIHTHLLKRWQSECFNEKGVLYQWRLSGRRSYWHHTENQSLVGWTIATGLPGSLLPPEKVSSGNLRTVIINDNVIDSLFCLFFFFFLDPINLSSLHKLYIIILINLHRTMLCRKDKVADLVPVDIVINLMICAAWRTATHRTDTISIYNCCTGQQNPITWKQFVDLSFKYSRIHPTNDVLWYPDGRCHSSTIINKLCVTLQHTLPAHILDTFARLKGSRPIMVRVQAKLSKAAKCLEYFSTKEWNFRDDNVRRLGEQLSLEDRETFMFDVRQIDWPSYLEHYILGIRQFILKESPDTLPAARSHITKWDIFFFAVNAISL